MLLGIAVVLAILWFLGFLVFHVASALIHVVLAIAVVLVIWHFVSARRGA